MTRKQVEMQESPEKDEFMYSAEITHNNDSDKEEEIEDRTNDFTINFKFEDEKEEESNTTAVETK